MFAVVKANSLPKGLLFFFQVLSFLPHMCPGSIHSAVIIVLEFISLIVAESSFTLRPEELLCAPTVDNGYEL